MSIFEKKTKWKKMRDAQGLLPLMHNPYRKPTQSSPSLFQQNFGVKSSNKGALEAIKRINPYKMTDEQKRLLGKKRVDALRQSYNVARMTEIGLAGLFLGNQNNYNKNENYSSAVKKRGTIQKSRASKAHQHLEFLHPKQASHFREMLSNPKTRGKAIKAIEAIKANSSMTSRLARDIEVMRRRIANPSIKSKVPSRSGAAIRQNVMNVLEPAMFYRRLKGIPSDARRSAISERIRTNKYNLPK